MADIDIDYSVDEVSDQSLLSGEFRIKIDGKIITEPTKNSGSSSGFIGTFVHRDLYNLLEACISIKSGNAGVYREISSEIESTIFKLIFEPLNRDYMRVAFRQWQGTSFDNNLPDPDVSNGYVVGIDDFCIEAQLTAETFVQDCEKMGLSTDESILSSIRKYADQLDNLINEGSGVID